MIDTKEHQPTFLQNMEYIKSEIVVNGERGSFKSSVVAFKLCSMMYNEIVAGHVTNVVCVREDKTNLRTSVHKQIIWTLDKMGYSMNFNVSVVR